MSTPVGEPFAEAVGEAVQTSVMAVRLFVMLNDAVRRAAEKRAGGEERPVPPADEAAPEAARDLKNQLPEGIAATLMAESDWPQVAQQLVALKRAGVDMEMFLPQLSETAVAVRDAVAANADRVRERGDAECAGLLRETMPAGPVREAILASPAWPDIAATMTQLQERGVDVRQILVSAHEEGAGVDQAVARVMKQGAEPQKTLGRDAVQSYGPLTEGLDIPKDLDLGDRSRALAQLGVSRSEHERYSRRVQDALPGREREAALLLTSRQWPLVAARMARMEDAGEPVREHLARLMRDTSWEKGPTHQLGSRMVEATNEALRVPLGRGKASPVSTTAAKAQSGGPTRGRPGKAATAAEPAVAPHRTEAMTKRGRQR